MANKTGIEWADATWNPVTGCTKVSPGCAHCYAETLFHRFRAHFGREFTDVQTHPERLDEPGRWRQPRRVFVCSMADLFHQDVPAEFIAQVFAVMRAAQHHTFMVLTKRPVRLAELVAAGTLGKWPANAWAGVSAENQLLANARIPVLASIPGIPVRFVSAEPLLGTLDLSTWLKARALQWVIAGGESGPVARPAHPQWFRDLGRQCTRSGTPYFFKQWGSWAPWEGEQIAAGRRALFVSAGGDYRAAIMPGGTEAPIPPSDLGRDRVPPAVMLWEPGRHDLDGETIQHWP